jgi:hypothetical protein
MLETFKKIYGYGFYFDMNESINGKQMVLKKIKEPLDSIEFWLPADEDSKRPNNLWLVHYVDGKRGILDENKDITFE